MTRETFLNGKIVKLPYLKQRIYDVIRRSGPSGISHDDLFGIIYQHHQKLPSRKTIKAHVWQLRRLGFNIHGERGGQHDGVYRLITKAATSR
jgi:hypothetical protein